MSRYCFLSPSIYNYLDIHNWAQVTLHSTPGYPRDRSICASENRLIGPRRRLQSQGSGGIGSGDLNGKGDGERRWVGSLLRLVCCSCRDPLLSLKRLQSLRGGAMEKGKRKRQFSEENWRECISCFLPWITARGLPTEFWDSPTRGFPYLVVGTSKAPCANKHTHLPTLLPALFFFFFKPACFYRHPPKFSSKSSTPIRETKNLSYRATFCGEKTSKGQPVEQLESNKALPK